MTKREQILQSVLTKLKSVNGVQPNSVVRSRVDPFLISKLPAITIEPVSDTPNANNLSFTDWDLILRISVYQSGQVPDSSADPIIDSIHQIMMSDQNFCGLVFHTNPQNITFEFDEGDKPIVKISYDFELKYRTNI